MNERIQVACSPCISCKEQPICTHTQHEVEGKVYDSYVISCYQGRHDISAFGNTLEKAIMEWEKINGR